MALTLKQSSVEAGEVRGALRRRVTDQKNREFTEREVEARMQEYLLRTERLSSPIVPPGMPIGSYPWAEVVRDQKFQVGALNGRLERLEEDIRTYAKETFGILQDVQQEISAIDSLLTEEEVKTLQFFDTVHYNSFIRSIDYGLGGEDNSWRVDFKTGIPFLKFNKSSITPGMGLTLPIKNEQRVIITDAVLVAEETDFGTTRRPLFSNSPRNVFLQNKVFRHVVGVSEYKNTLRFTAQPAEMTLLLSLANMQTLNSLVVRPVGQTISHIAELSYVNEAGESVVISGKLIDNERSITVLFEPVRTKHLKIKFKQWAAVSKGSILQQDRVKKELNDILGGIGFSVLLNEEQEEFQGRVHEFAIQDIELALIQYESLGLFRSQDVNVSGPLGATVESSEYAIDATRVGTFNAPVALPTGTVFNEYYLGLKLEDKNTNTLLNDLIPIPDSYPTQREFLAVIGGDAKVKLFPDLRWNLDKYRIMSIVETGTTGIFDITLADDHGLTEGEEYFIQGWGPLRHPINEEIFVNAETSNTFRNDSPITGLELSENSTPRSYAFITSGFSFAGQSDPLSVYKGNTLLSIGTEYLISIDGGANYVSDWPRGISYTDALRTARSGRFHIRLINWSIDSVYYISYRPLNKQMLGRTNMAMLKNGAVVFSSQLSESTGTINTVIVQRANTRNPFLSTVTEYYALKVRENVS